MSHKCEHHHCDDHEHRDTRAPSCDDQLPVFSSVGRGLQGDSYKVECFDNKTKDAIEINGVLKDLCTGTWLEGIFKDAATGKEETEWKSTNVNGGQLWYQYHINIHSNPQTFTITFIYRRADGNYDWSWTTPAIPFVWDQSNMDDFMSAGVANEWMRTMHTPWSERLKFPLGTSRDDYNAPVEEHTWAASTTFGINGDIEVVDLWDLAKILGITEEDIRGIIGGNGTGGYIDILDKMIQEIIDDAKGPLLDKLKELADKAYPIGSVYISELPTSPASILGGEWKQISNKFLRAGNDTSTGGNDTLNLSGAQAGSFEGSFKIAGTVEGNGDDRTWESTIQATSGSFSHENMEDNSWPPDNLSTSSPTNGGRGKDSGGPTTFGAGWRQTVEMRHVEVSSNGSSGTGSNTFSNMPAYKNIYMWKRVA